MKKELKSAYAAGIFDGEGYVDIYKATQSKASKNPSFMLRVVISQKDGKVMNWLQKNFGGYVHRYRRNSNYIYRWDIRSQAAFNFLTQILPFSLIKKAQIQLALDFEEKKGKYLETLKGFRGFRTLTQDEIYWRLKTKEHLKRLKKEYSPYIKNGAAATTK
ncbi:MAG: hypothetical protein KGJ90_02150 [Patescibacteria group bacterium]|nr:hypothetical protein [Patescibacteria group bacterium]